MNDISLQQSLNAKPSAPSRDAGKANEKVGREAPQAVNQAEVSKATNTGGVSVAEKMAELRQEKAQDEQVEQAVAKLNDYVQNTERKLEFQVDEEFGETVVRVYDKYSDKLIRQIPNEEAVELAKRLNDSEPLMLFSAQV